MLCFIQNEGMVVYMFGCLNIFCAKKEAVEEDLGPDHMLIKDLIILRLKKIFDGRYFSLLNSQKISMSVLTAYRRTI